MEETMNKSVTDDLTFKVGQKIKIDMEATKRRTKILSGTIIAITENFIVIQGKNYRECIRLTDFMTGEAQVI